MAGSSIAPDTSVDFCEISAENSNLHLAIGHDLMDYFLRS
jgi:hypothetical protein